MPAMRSVIPIAAALLFAAAECRAQYGQGIAGSTWEGVWGVGSQPACLTLNADRAEIALVRAGVDLDNSFLFLGREQFGLFGFGRRIRVDTTAIELGDLTTDRERAVSLDLRVMGPSFSLRIGERQAIAFTNSVRASLTALDLNDLARKFGIDTIALNPGEARRVDEATVRSSAMSWTEHGLTYGRLFPLGGRRQLHAGITAKYLLGIFGLYADNRAPLLSALNDSVQTVTEVNMRYGLVQLTEAPWAGGSGGWVHGHGWGLDAGAVYAVLRQPGGQDAGAPGHHALRIGAAVTDIGRIRFNRKAASHAITNGSTTVSALEGLEIGGMNEVDTALSSLLLGDPQASRTGRAFTQMLPTAVHLSVDYRPIKHLALRMEAVRGTTAPIDGPSVRDQLSLTLRFETRNFCAALPVSADAFGNWGIGLMLRAAGFMIGTDRIGGLFGLNDLRGADLYFGAKVRLKGRKRPAGD
jgi:hypothetical protein